MDTTLRLRKVSKRLRGMMLAGGSNGLIFPDERGELTPFSLICRVCGQAKQFAYRVEKEFIIDITPSGGLRITSANELKSVSDDDMLKMVIDRHTRFGGGCTLKKERYDIECAVCFSPDVVLYGEILSDCYESECVGCFQCGGIFTKEKIQDYCIECIAMRKEALKDKGYFWEMLDMDLYCDGCPIQDVREGHGVTGDEVKMIASGRLVA